MNYSEQDYMCRVDFFKPHGKWYMTEEIDFRNYYNVDNCVTNFKVFLELRLKGRGKGMFAICLEPYHKHEFPIGCQL